VIAKTAKAAALCGVDASTLWRWATNDARVAACVFKRGYYVVDKLAALGLTTKPMADILADIQKNEERTA
jgi:hypothetical protein